MNGRVDEGRAGVCRDEPGTSPRQLTITPDKLLPGDRFKVRGGPYSGHTAQVVDVLRGRYASYRVRVRILSTAEVSLDYTDVVQVERP